MIGLKDLVSELLKDSIDIHVHGYPEFTIRIPPRLNNFDLANLMKSSSMKGFWRDIIHSLFLILV